MVWFADVGGFEYGLGLGFGVARVLLVGQTVPDLLGRVLYQDWTYQDWTSW